MIHTIRITPIFFLFTILFSQDLVDLYQAYLPDHVKYNTNLHNMINGQLKAKAKIHPDLIYFQIERTHLQILEQNNKRRTRRLSIFEEIEKRYIRRRSEWASSQINRLKKSPYNMDIKTVCFEILEKMLIDTKERANALQDNELTIDLAKQTYFKYLFYINTPVAFDSSINYERECHQYEREKYYTINSIYRQLQQKKELISEEKISGYLRYWYIFEAHEDGLDAYELLAVNLANKIDRLPFFQYGFSLGYNLNNAFDVIHDIKVPALTDPGKIYETSKTNQVVIAAQRYIPLNKAWMHFTYLNLELSAAFSASNERQSFSAGYNKQIQVADTLITEYLNFTKNEILIKKRNTYGFRISTPVYSISKVFFIDLGFGMSLYHIEYELNYEYEYLNRKSYFDDGIYGRELRTISSISDSSSYIYQNITDIYFNYLVSLDLRYQFKNHLFLNLSINQEYLAFKIGYNF